MIYFFIKREKNCIILYKRFSELYLNYNKMKKTISIWIKKFFLSRDIDLI